MARQIPSDISALKVVNHNQPDSGQYYTAKKLVTKWKMRQNRPVSAKKMAQLN